MGPPGDRLPGGPGAAALSGPAQAPFRCSARFSGRGVRSGIVGHLPGLQAGRHVLALVKRGRAGSDVGRRLAPSSGRRTPAGGAPDQRGGQDYAVAPGPASACRRRWTCRTAGALPGRRRRCSGGREPVAEELLDHLLVGRRHGVKGAGHSCRVDRRVRPLRYAGGVGVADHPGQAQHERSWKTRRPP